MLAHIRFCVLAFLLLLAVQSIVGNNSVYAETPQANLSTLPKKIVLATEAMPNYKVTLLWDGIEGASGYNVYRAVSSGGPYVLVAKNVAMPDTVRNTANAFQWIDAIGLQLNVDYFYTVRALQGGKEIAQSNEASRILYFAIVLDAVLAGYNKIALSWNGIAGASGYNLYRSSVPVGPYTLVAGNITTHGGSDGAASQFKYSAAAWTKTKTGYFGYTYVVRAVQGGKETLQSNEAGDPEPDTDTDQEKAKRRHLPNPKINLVVASTERRKITLFWTKFTAATSYNVYRSRHEGGPYRRIASRVKTPDRNPGVTDMFLFSDFNLPQDVSFFYVVRAVQRGREIAYSNAEDGIVEENAIPWDTGDATQILRMEREGINKVLDPDTDPQTGKKVPVDVGLLSITGPDGAIYEAIPNSEQEKQQ